MPLTAIAYETEVQSTNGPQIASKQSIASLTGVTKRYGNALALDRLNLALHPGEIVALLGPNGAGKSTAIKLLLGLIAPTSGSTRVFGSNPREAATRTRVGAMLQISRITEMLKVREHLDLFRSYYPNPLPMPDILRIAQLQGIEDRLFGQLSGGQRQRVLFALALCGNPDLIFLDEPTVGMDIEARRGLWAEIRVLAALGKTVLLTTHYLEEADALADRIIVINKGRVICEGTPAEIKHNSGGRRIRCCTTLSSELLQSLPTVTSVERNGEATIVTAVNAENVVREMLRRDETLSGLEIASPALEDAFLALTKA
ncbi:ABC transporter ATP-binding protein [Tunturibacter empetritectus]|uniref:ABC-2 type transport system ATP-binding protein n=1 Tax=Tunturiibacter lichenicola TaxID=2051959 RepID=A0A7W8J8Z2_9BACT|nr:ABC transporter ATP-binding protein [Edaphobacter lichenicola]MBB5344666.1 ABC-2 type transport system ATP-binding protein [Edaphobacter lichenicola]